MTSLGRPYHFKFFKGCLPQILLGLFLNTLTHISLFKKIWMFFIRIVYTLVKLKIGLTVSSSDTVTWKYSKKWLSWNINHVMKSTTRWWEVTFQIWNLPLYEKCTLSLQRFPRQLFFERLLPVNYFHIAFCYSKLKMTTPWQRF